MRLSAVLLGSGHTKEYIRLYVYNRAQPRATHAVLSECNSCAIKHFDVLALLCRIMLCCGIPGVEMLGTEEDWQKLLSKLEALKNLLEPIKDDLGLSEMWWSVVKEVFEKLLATYRGTPDYDWWSRIVTYQGFGSGPSGYTGWITKFMEMIEDPKEVYEFTSGLMTVPLTIAHPSGLEDTAALVAGCLGFTIHGDGTDEIPSVQPFQGWSLLLPKNSPFRVDRQ